MTKAKYLIMSLMVGIILFMMPTMVNATVLDNSIITVTTSKYSSDGSISVALSGLTLDLTHSYQYSLVKNVSETPTKWIDLVSPTETTANCVLSATTKEIKEVLKVANTGYLFIKDLNNVEDDTDDTNVVEKLSINLKLPFHEAIDIKCSEGRQVSFDRLYGIGKASYQFVKITDEDIIDIYLSNNRDTSSILSMLPTTVPVNGWNEMALYGSSPHAYSYDSTAGNKSGLYLIWGQMYGDSCRTIYGYTVYDNLPIDEEGPTVSKIEVTSPTKSGIYKSNQVVNITVYFNENITGTAVPTLKIRFGESEERTVTNGTMSENKITYTYTIVDSDVGQLAVTEYTGGTIKDASGNNATISSKIIGGYTIKANEEEPSSGNEPGAENEPGDDKGEGTQTVPVESVTLDKAELTLESGKTHTLVATVKPNNATNTAVKYTSSNEAVVKVNEKGVVTAISKGEATITATTVDGQKTATCKVTVKDETIAKVEIPKAGAGLGITVAIMAIIITCVVVYSKYNKLRDI